MYRRTYTHAELVFIEDQVNLVVEKYLGYYAAGCPVINISEDAKKVRLCMDIFKHKALSEVVYCQIVGVTPQICAKIIREKMPGIYVNDILLNPMLLQQG